MNRFILLTLVLGLVASAGVAQNDDHRGHRPPHEAKTKKHHEPKAKKAREPRERSDAAPKIRTIAGRVSATEERARDDARRALEAKVSEWLAPEVPPSWRPDPRGLESMIVETRITPTEKPYGTVYTAEIDANFSDALRAEFVHSYDHVLVRDRLLRLGGLLAFLLICLAAVSAFIRADEATKGYHTKSLRLLAAAGVGAAGVLIYQLLA